MEQREGRGKIASKKFEMQVKIFTQNADRLQIVFGRKFYFSSQHKIVFCILNYNAEVISKRKKNIIFLLISLTLIKSDKGQIKYHQPNYFLWYSFHVCSFHKQSRAQRLKKDKKLRSYMNTISRNISFFFSGRQHFSSDM